jgi:hypothetical protein
LFQTFLMPLALWSQETRLWPAIGLDVSTIPQRVPPGQACRSFVGAGITYLPRRHRRSLASRACGR